MGAKCCDVGKKLLIVKPVEAPRQDYGATVPESVHCGGLVTEVIVESKDRPKDRIEKESIRALTCRLKKLMFLIPGETNLVT